MRSILPLPFLLLSCSPPAPGEPGGTNPGSSGSGEEGGGEEGGGEEGGGEEGGGEEGGDDTGPGPTWPLAEGDPILRTGTDEDGPDADRFYEYTDVEALTPELALMVGQGGFSVTAFADGEHLFLGDDARVYSASIDGDRAWLSTRLHGLYSLDISDPLAPVRAESIPLSEPADAPHHEMVAWSAERQLLALAWRELGVVFMDPEGTVLGEIPVELSTGVQFLDDTRLLVLDTTQGSEGSEGWLALYDITELSAPVELDRVALAGTGRDLDTDGQRVIVAEGGVGTEVFSLSGDTLEQTAHLRHPGTAMKVALDGDHAWIAAWEVAALAWLGEGGPVIIGHEDPDQSATSIGASGGRALIGDWKQATALQLQEGLAGAEVVIPSTLHFDEGETNAYGLDVWNAGAWPLELELSLTEGYTASEESLRLLPDESAFVVVSPPETGAVAGELRWTGNDPDEAEGTVALSVDGQVVGTPHQDFALPTFQWPDETLFTWTLSEQLGQVVFLAYWAEF